MELKDFEKKIQWVINSDLTTYEIEKQTKITRATIANMKNKKDNYDYSKMSLQNAISLVNYANDLQESYQLLQDQGGFISFTSSLNEWFELANQLPVSDEMKLITAKLKDLTLNDMDLLQDLYLLFKDNINNEGGKN